MGQERKNLWEGHVEGLVEGLMEGQSGMANWRNAMSIYLWLDQIAPIIPRVHSRW